LDACGGLASRHTVHAQANIRQKKTHSVQTDQSNFRKEVTTQVFQAKESGTQTKAAATTAVPKPVTYMSGLRGAAGAKHASFAKVDLTLGIEAMGLKPRSK
jgi:hypothetical protein